MTRQDNFQDYYTPEPVREEDRALHKWPKGYWEQCDQLLTELRNRLPSAHINLVARLDGGFHVRLHRAGQTTSTSPGSDRVAALKQALAEVR